MGEQRIQIVSVEEWRDTEGQALTFIRVEIVRQGMAPVALLGMRREGSVAPVDWYLRGEYAQERMFFGLAVAAVRIWDARRRQEEWLRDIRREGFELHTPNDEEPEPAAPGTGWTP